MAPSSAGRSSLTMRQRSQFGRAYNEAKKRVGSEKAKTDGDFTKTADLKATKAFTASRPTPAYDSVFCC